ncbi:MAG TPA: hypothetical protein VFW87_03355 [Pirellulales bacterium]|nr:hypothetical protein [Pirellulales bacterium]
MPTNSVRPRTRFVPMMIGCAIAVLVLAAVGATSDPTAEVLAARRAKIAAMDPVQRQELLRRYERFSHLDAAEQQRLRDLQTQIDADPNAERLHRILARYHEWLKTIKPAERALLAELPRDKRVEEIERLQRHQRIAQRMEPLTRKDAGEIAGWINNLVKDHRDDVIAAMSEADRKRFEKQNDSAQQRWLTYRIFGGRRGSERQSRVSAEDIQRLAERLSPGARAELDKESNAEARRRLVGLWVYGMLYRAPQYRDRDGRRVNTLVSEELLEFLQTEVPPAEREQLLKKPREEMLRELRRMYFERGRAEDRFRAGGHGAGKQSGPPFERPRNGPRSKRPHLERPGPSE